MIYFYYSFNLEKWENRIAPKLKIVQIMQIITQKYVKESKMDTTKSLIGFYKDPPDGIIGLEKLEEMSLQRLKLLKQIEMKTDSMTGKKETILKDIKSLWSQHKLNITGTSTEKISNGKRDQISHFILRLAFCRTEDQRRWFLNMESKLFKYRLQDEVNNFSTNVISELMKDCNLSYTKATESEKHKFASELQACSRIYDKDTILYKVPFEEASNLLSFRRFFIYRGSMFVPESELVSIMGGNFKSSLIQTLVQTSKYLPQIMEDQRMSNLLLSLGNAKAEQSLDLFNNKPGEKINLQDIDRMAQESFPPCMLLLNRALRSAHHLKHYGRLQYGLFLKGLGLTLDEAIHFWRNEFIRKVGAEKFDKEYLYNIRHYYGKEGKRADYTPWGCSKIISLSPPGQQEYHGCPFKFSNQENLTKLLYNQYHLNSEQIRVIMQKKKEFQFQICCVRLFENSHNGAYGEGVGTHPNSYVNSSRALKDKKFAENMEKEKKVEKATNNTVKEEKSNENSVPEETKAMAD